MLGVTISSFHYVRRIEDRGFDHTMNDATVSGPIGFCRLLLFTALMVTALATIAHGQETPIPAATAPSPMAGPTPVPLAEVVTQAETVTANLRAIEADLASDQITYSVDTELPVLTREIDSRLVEGQKILNSRPSLDTLKTLEEDWKTIAERLLAWRSNLTTRATALEREITRLTQLEQTWSNTLTQVENTRIVQADPADPALTTTPPEVLRRIQTVVAAIKQTRDATEKRRTHVLTLQNRVAEQDANIAQPLAAIKRVRAETINRLFVKDTPAIWSGQVWSRDGQNLLSESQNSFTTQLSTLAAYAQRQRARFILHALILLSLIGTLYWARHRVRPLVIAEPGLEGVARVFNVPVATGLVLSILISGWVYPQAPRILSAILGAAALIPTIILLRRLVERPLFPVLNALVIFYLIDLLRTIATALPLAARLLFLAEMLGGLVFLAWFIKSKRLSEIPESERNWLWTILGIATRVAGLVFLAALIANALGYVSIASFAGDGILGSAYVAVILYAAVRIVDGVIMFGLRIRPLSLLGIVRHHRRLLRRRVQLTLRGIAVLVWALFTLEMFSLRAPAAEYTRGALSARLEVGQLSISLGNVVAFIVTVWLAFLLSKFLRFMLEEDIYPRVNLARGVPYAFSTMLHYAILLVGFFFAVAAMGIDMTKFTILAGAFGVGLGFGLQNIVNNFVSGLILLFERPVNVGDMIQVGGRDGRLRRIGLRASVIRTLEGSEVIVPNGQLISEEVLNWTLSDQQRRLEIPVGVAYGTDPERMIELLTEVGSKHPDIMTDPPPDALFLGFGDSALDFQLRAWTSNFKRWQSIKSELAVGIHTALRDARISIPFPQRDLHIKSVPSGSATSPAEGVTGLAEINQGD